MNTEKQLSDTNRKTWSVGSLVYTLPGLITLFVCLLGGEFAWAMKDRAIGNAATLRFQTYTKDPFIYSLLILSFPSFTNIFLMPIVSYLSDRHRGRWGRRIPYLAFTTPFIVVGAWGLGFSPYLGQWLFDLMKDVGWFNGLCVSLFGSAFTYTKACVIAFAVFWASLDFGATLAGALSGALINDVVPKSLLGRFFGFNRALSLLAGILFNYFLMGKVEAHFLAIFLGIGAVYGAGLTLLCTKVKEGTYPDPPPAPSYGSAAGRVFGPILTYFRQCFPKPFYVLVIAAIVLCGFSATPYNMYGLPFAKSPAIDMDMDDYGKVHATCYLISFCLSFLLGVVADKFHPVRASVVALLVYLASMVFGWFYVKDAATFKVVLYLHIVLSGCYFTISASLSQRLFPRSLFAQFHSASAMVSSAAFVGLATFCGWLLKRLDGDYRFVYLFGAVTTLLGAAGLIAIWIATRKYGGLDNYQAPDPGA